MKKYLAGLLCFLAFMVFAGDQGNRSLVIGQEVRASSPVVWFAAFDDEAYSIPMNRTMARDVSGVDDDLTSRDVRPASSLISVGEYEVLKTPQQRRA